VGTPWELPKYLWGEQRELCKRCAHFRELVIGGKHTGKSAVMRCVLNTNRSSHVAFGSCINMRYEGACGQAGLLFKEKQ